MNNPIDKKQKSVIYPSSFFFYFNPYNQLHCTTIPITAIIIAISLHPKGPHVYKFFHNHISQQIQGLGHFLLWNIVEINGIHLFLPANANRVKIYIVFFFFFCMFFFFSFFELVYLHG